MFLDFAIMNYTPFMSVFDVEPPIIQKKHLIKWLKINFSFLRNKLLKIKQLDSERDINFIIFINNKKICIKNFKPIRKNKYIKIPR